jgi:hypothetical protein
MRKVQRCTPESSTQIFPEYDLWHFAHLAGFDVPVMQMESNVAYLLKARTVEPEKQSLLDNSSKQQ